MDIELSSLSLHCSSTEYDTLHNNVAALLAHVTGGRAATHEIIQNIRSCALRYVAQIELPDAMRDALIHASGESACSLYGAMSALLTLVNTAR